MTPEIIVFFTSMIPFSDVKLAIPLGLEMGMSTTSTFIFAVAGSILPAAIVMALIKPVSIFLCNQSKFMNTFFNKLFKTTKEKHEEKFQRYGPIFIIFLVATPFPGSGTITGSVVSFLFGLEYWKALTFIVIGASIVALLMTAGFNSIFTLLEAIK